MSDAPTSTDKRPNADANRVLIRELLNGKEGILPSHSGTFGKFSRQSPYESSGAATGYYLHSANRFSPLSAFMAIV